MIDSDNKLATFAKLTIKKQIEKGREKGLNKVPWNTEHNYSIDLSMNTKLKGALQEARLREDWASVATYAMMLEAREYNRVRGESINGQSAS